MALSPARLDRGGYRERSRLPRRATGMQGGRRGKSNAGAGPSLSGGPADRAIHNEITQVPISGPAAEA